MNSYWEQVKNRKKVQEFADLKDASTMSALEYCSSGTNRHLYAMIQCFCSDESKIATLDYKELRHLEEWEEKQKLKLAECVLVNAKLNTQVKVDDAYKIEKFQYPKLDIKINLEDDLMKSVVRHDAT